MNKINRFLIVLCAIALFVCNGEAQVKNPPVDSKLIEIPLQGNTYTTSESKDIINSQNGGLKKDVVIDSQLKISTYFRVANEGDLNLSLRYSAGSDVKMKVTVASKTFTVNCPKGTKKDVFIGKISNIKSGYVRVDFSDMQNAGNLLPDLQSLLISGKATEGALCFVNNPDFYYWGRRGPSVHMGYTLPEGDTEWFYNEVTVPVGFDPVGSYFMANGFGEGYFGMQVNSETERRILFSVWSPFKTDNPKDIPEDEKILLNRKNDKTSSQSFGNEGSGGQNFMRYSWKAGITYKFLLHCRPDPSRAGYTEYTAYFHSPEEGWMLIASNSRPKIVTYYTRPHSFLENFDPRVGYITRKVYFDNQWAYVVGKGWQEVTKGRFTYDNTANQKQRMDYKGGIENGAFYLQNCGFFGDFTELKTSFERPSKGKMPEIDFKKLP